MFGSNPLDKSCIGPDCSTGRSSASSRFPVGITSLGDENQQIRIQLAVHKYNSSPNSPLNNRCSVTSPFRHSFLNNPAKAKNYEGDAEGTSKNEKRNGNQYEGVGAFPTIHLKKRAVRYRPIRRFNDVKVSYPELPVSRRVSRFLSNLPEACTDLKSSTRSVLDVLEDLSGKNIHLKDDNSSSSKTKSKGLGGDYLLNSTALYKPLFVQKPKVNSVVTRDNTTQTFPIVNTDTPSPQNSCTRNDASDARAELRRKLAKQNNEIFASLSSSISSPHSLKRRIGKVLEAGDESLTDGSATKNPKLDNQPSNINSISNSTSKLRPSSNDSIKISRKSKIHEPNSPISPNKDRLTKIFLNMENTRPKVQMFQNNSKSTDDDSTNNFTNGFTNGTNSFKSKNSTSSKSDLKSPISPNKDRLTKIFLNMENTRPKVQMFQNNLKSTDDSQSATSNGFTNSNNGFSDKTSFNNTSKSDLAENGKNDSSKKSSASLDPVVKTAELNKSENGKTENFATSQSSSTPIEATKSPSNTFQFGINTTATNFNSSATVESDSKCSDTSKKLESDTNAGKKVEENQFSAKPFVFGNTVSKPNFSSFQFGANGTSSPGLNVSKDSPKPSEVVPATSVAVSTPQFSFGTKTTSPTQTFTGQFNVTSGQNTSTSPSKGLFAFGQNNPTTSEIGKSTEKSNSVSTSTSAQAVGFSFGQKPTVESPVKSTVEVSASQPAGVTFSSGLSTNSSAPLQPGQTIPSFGNQVCTTTSTTTAQESKFSFTFGQKAQGNDQNKVEEDKSKNLFTFGQKSVSQESQNAGVSTNVTSTSQTTKTEMSSMFGQNVQSQVSSVPQIKFEQTSAPQITSSLGDKSQTNSLVSTSAPTFSQSTSTFPIKSSPFGSSANGFGSTTTQSSAGFKPTPASGSGLTFGWSATTQSTPTFGTTSTSQATPAFGTSTAQSIPSFGVSATTQSSSAFRTSGPTPAFGQPATTQSNSSFPISSTAQSTFAGTSTSQSVPGFGTSLVSQSAPSFGISSSTSTFGTSSALQSTSTFGAPTTQPTSVFGASTTQSTPVFGTSTTQSTSAFGATTQSTPAFGTSTTQSTPSFGAPQSTSAFGPPLGFGITTSNPNTVFGTSTASQSTVRFGAPIPQTNTSFGASTFSSASATQQNTTFGSPALTSTTGFGASQTFSQPFENKPTTSLGQSSSIFGQSQPPSFSSGTPFSTNQNNIFEQKPNTEGGGIFDSNKIQTPGFGAATQTFNSPNKYSFGMTTSSVGGFTTSPPNTTSAPVFSFGSNNTTPNTFNFGSGSSGTGSNQFAFKSSANEPFKFGATTTTKEGPGFGGGTNTFNFGGQMNNNAVPEQKPTFNFGSAQTSTSAPFSFGATPSPSVFNFGASTPASSGSGFSFGTPTPGGPFGQPSTASPGAPFAVPGTFSIGSGSSQSRPRATSRPRRRP